MNYLSQSVDIVNETMYVLTGRWITDLIWSAVGRFPHEGQPDSVEFDIHSIIEYQKKSGDVIGFYHTHPCEAYVSETDVTTMDCLVDSFGKPLLCLIEGTDGLHTWNCIGDRKYQRGKSYRWENNFWGFLKNE